MSATWYPIIDKEKCTGCFKCVEFCPHDVLAKGDGVAVVVKPDDCVTFCKGCAKAACEFDAISFFGDKKKA